MKARTLLATTWLLTALVAAGCGDQGARSAASRRPEQDRETARGATLPAPRAATQVEESPHDTGSPATPDEPQLVAVPPAPRSAWQPPPIPLPVEGAAEPVPPPEVAHPAQEMPLEPAAPQTPAADAVANDTPAETVPVPEVTPPTPPEAAAPAEPVASGSSNPLRRSLPAVAAPRPRPSLASNPLRASGSAFAPTTPAPTSPPPPLPLPSAAAPTAPPPASSTPLFPRIPRIASNPRIPTEPRDHLNLPLPTTPKNDNSSVQEPSGGAAPPADFVAPTPPPPPPFPTPAGAAPSRLADDSPAADAPRELVAAEGAPPTVEEMPNEAADAPANEPAPAVEAPEAAAVPESAVPDEVIPPSDTDSNKSAFRLGPTPPSRKLGGPTLPGPGATSSGATIEDDQFAHDDEAASADGGASDEAAAMGLLDNGQSPSGGAKGNADDSKKADPFTVVKVFYGTDRMPLAGGAAVAGKRSAKWLALFVLVMLVLSLGAAAVVYRRSHRTWACVATGFAVALLCVAIGRPVSLSSLLGKGGSASQLAYGNERGELAYGEVEVTIPKDHKVGEVERPSILRLELQERSDKHVVIRRIDQWEEKAFFENVKKRVVQSPREDLFVFIHGYNVSFDMAARRTAQMAHDMQFEGAPIFYSWPSQGGLLQYPVDENNVAWTVPHLKQFLRDLIERTDAKAVNVIAHSMGNRALSSAVRELALEKSIGDQQFNQIVLAAPDIDAEVFKRDIAPVLTKTSHKVTLYASSHDQALVASKLVHGYPRAGDSGSNLMVIPGVETIDVSDIDTGILGHSYYANSRPILRDLNVILRTSQAAARRPWLEQAEHDGLGYWVFEAKTIATRDAGPRR